MPETGAVITLTTDFGTREYYVGAVKGVICAICPSARIVDITHEVASHDILEAAFTLACACTAFPPGAIHLVVVDPGVGSARRGLVVETDRSYFVAPDNGVLTLALRREHLRRIVSIESGQYFNQPVSATFHGRDVFGPVAAYIGRGAEMGSFGPEVSNYSRLPIDAPRIRNGTVLEGVVLHIDKFGNVITNISPADGAGLTGVVPKSPVFRIGHEVVDHHVKFYAEGEGIPVFSLLGSSGFYEIAAWQQPASRLLRTRRGDRVEMTPGLT